MAIFINQIKKRRQLEDAQLAEVRQRTAERLGFRFERRSVPQDDRSALVQILAALDVNDYEFEDDGMLSAEELLTGILRPRGIMMRRIRLKGKWWNECVGPLLGYSKDGRLVALTQTRSGLGYQYRDSEGFIRKVSHKEMAENLKSVAYTFTKPLPFKSLGVKDLLKFSWSTIGGPNVLMLIVSTLIVLLLGMFTPMANKLIFDTVIPTGDAADLLPITGLLAGAVIGTVLMTFTRNLYVHRIRNIVELHTQNAIMARTFLLSPTFFSKNPRGRRNTSDRHAFHHLPDSGMDIWREADFPRNGDNDHPDLAVASQLPNCAGCKQKTYRACCAPERYGV